MKKASIFDVTTPIEVTLIKIAALLHIEQHCRELTPDESKVFMGDHNNNALEGVYYKSECFKHSIRDPFSLRGPLYFYVDDVAERLYDEALGFDLLEDAYSHLYEPQNDIYTVLFRTPYGKIIKCCDFSETLNLAFLEGAAPGFVPNLCHELLNGMTDAIAVQHIMEVVYRYHLGDARHWVVKDAYTNFNSFMNRIFMSANHLLMQMKNGI